MALDMTTALTIRAQVTGQQQITGLTKGLDGVTRASNNSATAMGRLKGAAAGALGAVRTLLPALGVAAVAKFAKDNLDAADAMSKLSQRTGIAAPTLDRFRKVAELSDTSIEALGKAFTILAKNSADAAQGTGPAADAFEKLGIKVTDASGKLLSTDNIMLQVADRFAKMADGTEKAALASDIFGSRLGSQLIPLLNSGGDAVRNMSTALTQEFADRSAVFNDRLENMQEKVQTLGLRLTEALLPALETIVTILERVGNAFSVLPEPLQQITASVIALAGAWALLAPIITPLLGLLSGLAGLQIGATLAGWAGAIGPLVASLTGSGGLLAAITAVFTGPVGWVALIAAAGVAIYAFRDQIAQVFKSIYQAVVSAFQNMAGALRAPFEAAASFIGNIFGSILRAIAGRINFVISLINRLISGYNRLPSPDIPLIPQLSVPAFANGGVVNRPTLAMVGEGGEREFIIPESKMATASANYLAGVRGGSVIPRGNSATATNGTVVNIRTGPVMQQDGQQYVTMGDLEGALQTMADTLLGNGRSTGGRRYAGIG